MTESQTASTVCALIYNSSQLSGEYYTITFGMCLFRVRQPHVADQACLGSTCICATEQIKCALFGVHQMKHIHSTMQKYRRINVHLEQLLFSGYSTQLTVVGARVVVRLVGLGFDCLVGAAVVAVVVAGLACGVATGSRIVTVALPGNRPASTCGYGVPWCREQTGVIVSGPLHCERVVVLLCGSCCTAVSLLCG